MRSILLPVSQLASVSVMPESRVEVIGAQRGHE